MSDPLTVSGYSDLVDVENITETEADTILSILDDESDALRVFVADEWLWTDKGLDNNPRAERVVSGRIIAETEKAYLVTQLGTNYNDEQIDASQPQTDWVPKSVVQVLAADPEAGVQSTGPQSFLGEYADE